MYSLHDLNKTQLQILYEFANNIPLFTFKLTEYKNMFVININDHICIIRFFNAELCDVLRGYEFDMIWIDELLKFNNAYILIDQTNMCLRNGKSKCIITTTPVKNDDLLNQIIKNHKNVVITHGTSYENTSLSNNFQAFIRECDDTTLLEREINAVIFSTTKWTKDIFIYVNNIVCDIYYLGIDIAIKNGDVGLILLGIKNENIYVIKSIISNSREWIFEVQNICNIFDNISIIYEFNQGGVLIESLIKMHDIHCNIYNITVSQSKFIRHNYVLQYYLHKKIIHTNDVFLLENQMIKYKKFDLIDALYIALNYNKFY